MHTGTPTESHTGTPTGTPAGAHQHGALRQAVADVIGTAPDEIPGDANLVYLGLGSLEMMRLVTRWRRDGIAVDFAVLAADPTLDAWERHAAEVTA